jgi:hypothetical protein
MLRVVRDEVFPHFRKLNGGTTFAEYMQDAQLMIQKPSLLVSAVNMIDKLPITEGDAKGDLYEYLLSKLTTAGINGQFRTPRHIIRFMVELLEPKPTETIGDPACGTAGFLVGAMQYLLESTPRRRGLKGENGEVIYTGDKLEPYRAHIQKRHVPRLRLRRDHAPHRVDEPDAPRRRQPGHPLPGHAVQQLPREVRQAGRRAASTSSSPTRRSRAASTRATFTRR